MCTCTCTYIVHNLHMLLICTTGHVHEAVHMAHNSIFTEHTSWVQYTDTVDILQGTRQQAIQYMTSNKPQ